MLIRSTILVLFMLLVSCSSTPIQTNTLVNRVLESPQPRTALAQLQQHPTYTYNSDLDIVDQVLQAIEHYTHVDSINPKSTFLFQDAQDMLKTSQSRALKQWVNSEIGYYYFSYDNYLQAAPPFIEVYRTIQDSIGNLCIQPAQILLRTAQYFETVQAYDKSNSLLKHALNTVEKQNSSKAQIYYSLASVALKQKNIDKAEHFYRLSNEKSKELNDTLAYSKALGGLALVYNALNKPDTAIAYLKKDIAISQKINHPGNTMSAQLELGKIYLEQGLIQQAKQVLEQAYQITLNKTSFIGQKKSILNELIKISMLEQNLQQEIKYRRDLDRAEATMQTLATDEVMSLINWQQINDELQHNQQDERQKNNQRILLFTILVLLLTIAFILFKFSKQLFKPRTKPHKSPPNSAQSVQPSTQNIVQDVVQEPLEDTSDQQSSVQQSDTDLEATQSKQEPDLEQPTTTNLPKLLKSHLMTEENWQIFKQTFIKEQPQYMEYLQLEFPSLTETNLRIILLQKIGLNNQEAANILGVTIDAVKKAKQCLRKKYDTPFENFLEQKQDESSL